jgi:small GTP-binding protein
MDNLDVVDTAVPRYRGIKGVLLGRMGVGKTEFARRLHDKHSTSTTVGVDMVTTFADFTLHGKHRSELITLWDTAGQERYQAIIKAYMRGVQIYFLVCDLSDNASQICLVRLAKDCESACEQVPGGIMEFSQSCFHIIANKSDLRTADELLADKQRIEGIAKAIEQTFPKKHVYYDICSALRSKPGEILDIIQKVAQQYAEENVDDFLHRTEARPFRTSNSPPTYKQPKQADCCTANSGKHN